MHKCKLKLIDINWYLTISPIQCLAAAFGILDDDLVTDKYGQDWKYKPTHAESCPPFTSKPKNYNSSDYDFRDTFSPSSRLVFCNTTVL